MDTHAHHHHIIGYHRLMIQVAKVGRAEVDGLILMEALQEEVEKDGTGMAPMVTIQMARLSRES